MNTHLKQLWAAMKLPEKLQKSYKFFCRGLDIRVPEIVIPDLSHSLCLEQFRKTLCDVVGLDQIANLIDTYILKITLFFAGSCMSNTSSI